MFDIHRSLVRWLKVEKQACLPRGTPSWVTHGDASPHHPRTPHPTPRPPALRTKGIQRSPEPVTDIMFFELEQMSAGWRETPGARSRVVGLHSLLGRRLGTLVLHVKAWRHASNEGFDTGQPRSAAENNAQHRQQRQLKTSCCRAG